GIRLDVRKDLAAVLTRQIQIEQDEVRTYCVGKCTVVAQECQCFDAVADDVQVVADLSLLQALDSQTHVAWIIFDEQNFDRPTARAGHVAQLEGSVNSKVVPAPGCDSTWIVPPCRSTIFLQIARPIPVPGYSARECSRWKRTKIRSTYCGSIPIPLSL